MLCRLSFVGYVAFLVVHDEDVFLQISQNLKLLSASSAPVFFLRQFA